MKANNKSGQALFTAQKLRSEGLVTSSGAQSAPPNSTSGSYTARLFPPRLALRSETCGRSALRFAHIREKGHGQQSSTATIVCQGDIFTFKLDQTLADNGGIFLVIEATEGQSNGVSHAHSKASSIKLVEEPTDAAIDIRSDYVAKYGAPSAAAPKIFFRYYYVNSSTGEKSGTMLAECKWAAADAGGEP